MNLNTNLQAVDSLLKAAGHDHKLLRVCALSYRSLIAAGATTESIDAARHAAAEATEACKRTLDEIAEALNHH